MIDYYLCVFFAGDPANSRPAAIFDRMQFLGEFLAKMKGQVEFREHDINNDIWTFGKWLQSQGENSD